MNSKRAFEIKRTKNLSEAQFQEINQLWNKEYPKNLKDRFSLLLKSAEKHNHYLVEGEDQKLIAWAVDFEKDLETRFSIIVASEHQGIGIGKLLVNALNKNLGEYYGWVIDHDQDVKLNGDHYRSPLQFYLNHGFELLVDQRINNEILSAVKIKRSI